MSFWSFIFKRVCGYFKEKRLPSCWLTTSFQPTYLPGSRASHLRTGNPTAPQWRVSTRLGEPRCCWTPWDPCCWTGVACRCVGAACRWMAPSWQRFSIRFLSSLCLRMAQLLPTQMVLLFLTKKLLSFLPLSLFFFSLTFFFHFFLLKPVGFILFSSFFLLFPIFSFWKNICVDSQLFALLFLHVIVPLSEQQQKSLFIFCLPFLSHTYISLGNYCFFPGFHAHGISFMFRSRTESI